MVDLLRTPRPLHLQTIDSLLADLISSVGISVGENNAEFRLPSAASRSILNWYRLNRSKWANNVMAADIEAMVSEMTNSPPNLPPADATAPKPGRRLNLVKVVAHRFAGVHAYGTMEAPPPDFVFEPRAPITLFEGWNGAGKTSLINTIIWCLTGELLRPQRPPESGQREFSGTFVRTLPEGDGATTHTLTPITPLPNPASYVPPIYKAVPADSWVELTFKDQDGNLLPPIRRAQLRNPRDRISEITSGFETLGIDPIALRIGTVMPALLPFLRVGSTSDLGLAAARLTGLADISSLAKHASKARDRLQYELRKERVREIEDIDKRFLEARSDLRKQIEEYPEMALAEPLPVPSEKPSLEQSLKNIEDHFNRLKEAALRSAQTILGIEFDPSDKQARSDLEASIGPAQGQLRAMAQLPSVRRARDLSELTEANWQAVGKLIDDLRFEAAVLAELSTTPDIGRRKQLYARVAAWIRDFGHHDPSSCAICSRSLDGIVDPVTRRPVVEHLAEISEAEQQLLSTTIQHWAEGWKGKFATGCPPNLQPELNRDLPQHPRELIRSALVEDLFETEAFSGTLASLKNGLSLACDRSLATLPKFIEPAIDPLPSALNKVSAPLLLILKRLARARAFAQWRSRHLPLVAEATKEILQGQDSGSEIINESTPIRRKLDALASLVKGVAPLNAALELGQRMLAHLKTRRSKEERLALYERAAEALASILELGSLAEAQVETLRKLLHSRALYWRDRCYHNSFPMAGHGVRGTSMDVRGVLEINVGFESATAPAQHISNASALRASLLGFFLAFWEYVLKDRGGISLLILDDPQELLDHDNKERLARLLPELTEGGAQLLVTTYDRYFARAVVAAARKHAVVEHRSVHPVNPIRQRLETAPAVEELDLKRNAYERDKDDASRAQDYADEVRVFLEARLADLFDDPSYPAYATSSKHPTLADHLGRLRSLVNSPPNALFRGKAVTEFATCKMLTDDSECMRILNVAHHNKNSLSAGDVYAVRGKLDQTRVLAEKMHLEFRHWRWREPLQPTEPSSRVVPFRSVDPAPFSVLILPDLAAFTANSAQGPTQDEASESVDSSWFADKSLFLVRTNNLGFAVPDGCIAIVESNAYDGRDHNLVIARQRGHLLARRLFRPANSDELALAAEAPDPRESKPTLRFSVGDIVLHRIVGMLTEQPPPIMGRGEATELTHATSLSRIEAAYRVREDSGIPLALPGQVVLGGSSISKEELPTLEGALIALGLDNGSNVFKRVGRSVPDTDGRLWQFESIGGLGNSIVVSLAEADETTDAPRFACARRIIGVLYLA
jgi:hypothetical protein